MSVTNNKTMKRESKNYYLLILILFALCITKVNVKAQTVNEVRTELERLNVKHVTVVLRQSILETGHYNSYSCKTRLNLFGFRWKGKYLVFDTWQESCKYYADWQGRHFKGGDYYKFLTDRGYATDPKYISKLKSIKI